jgi:hypothetical protein
VTVDGAAAAAGTPFALVVRDPDGAVLCEVAARLGSAAAIPAACVARATSPPDAPGHRLGLGFRAAAPLPVGRIAVDGGIAYVEGESFRNAVRDGGADGRAHLGAVGMHPRNGVAMAIPVSWPISPAILRRRVEIAAGAYDVWALVYGVAAAELPTRASMTFRAGNDEIGRVAGVERPPDAASRPFVPRWVRVGTLRAAGVVDLAVEVSTRSTDTASADLDAVALVPLS